MINNVLAWWNSVGVVSSRISSKETSGNHGGLFYDIFEFGKFNLVSSACLAQGRELTRFKRHP